MNTMEIIGRITCAAVVMVVAAFILALSIALIQAEPTLPPGPYIGVGLVILSWHLVGTASRIAQPLWNALWGGRAT